MIFKQSQNNPKLTLICSSFVKDFTLINLTNGLTRKTSVIKFISSSHSYGNTNTDSCNFRKPKSFNLFLNASLAFLNLSGMSKITIRHSPSHLGGFLISISSILNLKAFFSPSLVNTISAKPSLFSLKEISLSL